MAALGIAGVCVFFTATCILLDYHRTDESLIVNTVRGWAGLRPYSRARVHTTDV